MRERIESRHGHRQLSYMEELGMGNRRYLLLDVDDNDLRIQPADAVKGVVPFVELRRWPSAACAPWPRWPPRAGAAVTDSPCRGGARNYANFPLIPRPAP